VDSASVTSRRKLVLLISRLYATIGIRIIGRGCAAFGFTSYCSDNLRRRNNMAVTRYNFRITLTPFRLSISTHSEDIDH